MNLRRLGAMERLDKAAAMEISDQTRCYVYSDLAWEAIGLLRELQEELELELNELAHRMTTINPDSLDLERRAREFLDGQEETK